MAKYWKLIGVVVAVAAFMVVLVVADSEVGAVPPEPPLVAIGSAKIVNFPTNKSFQESDSSIINFSQSPLVMGTVNSETGKVENGDYLVYLEADLGSAPLQNAGLLK